MRLKVIALNEKINCYLIDYICMPNLPGSRVNSGFVAVVSPGSCACPQQAMQLHIDSFLQPNPVFFPVTNKNGA